MGVCIGQVCLDVSGACVRQGRCPSWVLLGGQLLFFSLSLLFLVLSLLFLVLSLLLFRVALAVFRDAYASF